MFNRRYRINRHLDRMPSVYLFLFCLAASIWILVVNRLEIALVILGISTACALPLQRQHSRTRYHTALDSCLNDRTGDLFLGAKENRKFITNIPGYISNPLIGLAICMSSISSLGTTVMAGVDATFMPGKSTEFSAMLQNVGIAAFTLSVGSGIIIAMLITVIFAIPAIRIAAASRITPRPIKSPGPGVSRRLPDQTPRTQQRIRQDRIFGAFYAALLVGTVFSSSVAASIFYLMNRSPFSSGFYISALIMVILVLLSSIAVIMFSPNPRAYVDYLVNHDPQLTAQT